MKNFKGVDYITVADLAEWWGVAHYRINNVRYSSYRTGDPFPKPDGTWHNSKAHIWRASRRAELTDWWVRNQGPITVKEVAPDVSKVAEKVLFQDMDITLTLTHSFPQYQNTHVLAIVSRHGDESPRSRQYFITREQADFIESLFN